MNQNPGCLGLLLKIFGAGSKPEALTYKRAAPLLSLAEQTFYHALQQSVGQTYWIFPKVRLADIIWPNAKYRSSPWWTAFNKINKKHVDFVACHPETYDVVAVFELDDSTHNKQDRRERDLFVDQALASANIPIHHIKATDHYKPEELLALFE